MKNIRPGGLKGKEKLERMKSLMGKSPINENVTNSKIELTKLAPDNKVYGIVRENHEYYIKTTEKINDLQLEDFQYIGGLANKKNFAFESYAKALRKLNLKMISLNEQFEGNKVNVFENDNLFSTGNIGMGDGQEETLEENSFEEEEIFASLTDAAEYDNHEMAPGNAMGEEDIHEFSSRASDPADGAIAGAEELARLIQKASQKAPGMLNKIYAVLQDLGSGAGAALRDESVGDVPSEDLTMEGELKVKAVNDGPKELKGNSTGDYEEVTTEPDDAPNDKSTGTEKEGSKEATPKKTVKESKKPKYSILNAMDKMDSIIESLDKKKSLAETKYKLKVDDPSPEPKTSGGGESIEDFPEEPAGEPMPDMGIDDMGGESEPNDKPFDDTPFDAGVEADEDSDPKNYIQQLSGKLGQSLRSYSDDNGVDYDLEKFAINSVVSATHAGDMEEEDIDDIIDKLRSAGKEGGEESNDEPNDVGTPEAEGDTPMDPPAADTTPASVPGGLGEGFYTLPKDHKQVFKDAKLGVVEGEEELILGGDDYSNIEDLERLERQVDYGINGHDTMEEDDVINPEDSLSNKEKKDTFVGKNIDYSIDRMIQDYLNTQQGFQEEVAPEVRPAPTTTPEPEVVPRRRKPFRVKPNVSPPPKATN